MYCFRSSWPHLSVIQSWRWWQDPTQDLASFLQVQPGLRPIPHVSYFVPLGLSVKARAGATMGTFSLLIQLQPGNARELIPHKSYLWPDGGRGQSWAGRWTLSSLFPWADSGETFMQLYMQPWQAIGHLWTGFPAFSSSLSCHSPPPASNPQLALASGFAFSQNQFKTKLIKN